MLRQIHTLHNIECKVDYEFITMPKEAVIAYFEVLSWNSCGGTEENDETPQSGMSISGPKCEHGTSLIRGNA